MTTWTMSRRAALAGMAALPLVPGRALAETVGTITRFDAGLDAVVDVGTPIEVLSTGHKWAEGPVWVKAGGYLLFTDPAANILWRWKAGEGATQFANPSGLAGPVPKAIREPGANGLTIDAKGRLILADSGSRNIAAMDLKTKRRTVLADRYQGKRFNSCNDVVIGRGGAIYFTDPPYGLAGGDESPLREMGFNGVFMRLADGTVKLIDDKLHRPNGVALCPKRTTLYVAMSDEKRPQILAYPLDLQGMPRGAPTLFHDFADVLAQGLKGMPDGLKVDKAGRVFASGPGGIYVLTPEGQRLGRFETGKAIANCAFGEDGKTLFLTADTILAKVRLKTPGW